MLPINRENLEIGKLYYIENLTQDENDNIIPNPNITIMVGIFKGLKYIHPIIVNSWNAAIFDWLEISNMKHIKNESDSTTYIIQEVELNCFWRFYEVKKFKIQNDMEQRAVNLYLRKIIGDPYFVESI
jgi:hypothetical protein